MWLSGFLTAVAIMLGWLCVVRLRAVKPAAPEKSQLRENLEALVTDPEWRPNMLKHLMGCSDTQFWRLSKLTIPWRGLNASEPESHFVAAFEHAVEVCPSPILLQRLVDDNRFSIAHCKGYFDRHGSTFRPTEIVSKKILEFAIA
jgi:hypothetical protein